MCFFKVYCLRKYHPFDVSHYAPLGSRSICFVSSLQHTHIPPHLACGCFCTGCSSCPGHLAVPIVPSTVFLSPEQISTGANLRLLLKCQCFQDMQCLDLRWQFPTVLLRGQLQWRVTDIYKKVQVKTCGTCPLKRTNGLYLLPSSIT